MPFDAQTRLAVASALRDRGDAFRDTAQRALFTYQPQASTLFSPTRSAQHIELAPALAWVIEHSTNDGLPTREAIDRLRELGRAHRRLGFPPAAYDDFARALGDALRATLADDFGEELDDVETLATATCTIMGSAANKADLEGLSPAHAAEVVEVERRTRDLTVVRLESGLPIEYRPGQYMPVTTSYLPGVWRHLAPAVPPNKYGQVEFHIRRTSSDAPEGFAGGFSGASGLLASTKVGDMWTLGPARGTLEVSGSADILMIAHDVGLAPLRAILFSLLDLPLEKRPRVHLFVSAASPGELYDLMGLWNLSTVSSWLSVVPVVRSESDPWWVSTENRVKVPRGLHLQATGPVGEIVASYGSWSDREVLVAGPGPDVVETVTALRRGGTPQSNIQTLTFEWAPQRKWS